MDLSKQNFHESDRLVGPSNYPIWAFKVERIFRNYNVWDIVCPTSGDTSESFVEVSKSSDVTPSSTSQDKGKSPAEATPSKTKSSAKEVTQSDKLEKCLCIYSYTISSKLIATIKRMGVLKDPAQTWERLKTRFESSTTQRKLDLRKELRDLTMKEGMTVDQLLEQIDVVVTKLADIDETVSDAELIHLVLGSLPPSWASFKSTFGTIMDANDKFTFYDLEQHLHSEERRQQSNQAKEQSMAVSQRRWPKKGQSSSTQNNKSAPTHNRKDAGSNRKQVNCTSCGKRGHHYNDCRLRQTVQQLQGLKLHQLDELQRVISTFHTSQHNRSFQAEQHLSEPEPENSSDDAGEDSQRPQEVNLAMSIEGVHLSDFRAQPDTSWIVDSGASSHYSNSTQDFSIFQPQTTPNSVTTASGAQMSVEGTGLMHFGNNKKASPVLYVPSIKSNLLSVGSFTDQGHFVLFDSQKCYVMDKTGSKVYITGHRDPSNRLYKFCSSSVVHPSLPASHLACALFDPSDATTATERLWHRRLGHPNYQRL
jgi:hypothetical protein